MAALLAGLLAGSLSVAGCGADENGTGGKIAGDITVLTQRTDIVDTVFQEYKKTFEAKYPGTNVKFEAITNYESEVRIRMNTRDYGDVLLIPSAVTNDQFASFFEPFGTVADLKKKYRFVADASGKHYEGTSYGLAITGNAQGYLYNKRVWRDAGITAPPKTPAEFLAALQAIKDRTDAIPLYTNYKDGWPLSQWEYHRGGITADPDAVNKLTADDAPWAPGKEHYIIDSLLYDAVKAGLTEEDPTTTNWEASKGQFASGKIGTIVLGSWAVAQMRKAAKNPADVGYWPFPTQVDGAFHSVIGGDFNQAINRNSDNKATARAWIDWFTDESNYATDEGGIPPLIGGTFPDTLADMQAAGVKFLELNPPPKGQEGLDVRIDKAGELGLYEPEFRQRLVDAARGARKETKEQIFADQNRKWAQGRKEATG